MSVPATQLRQGQLTVRPDHAPLPQESRRLFEKAVEAIEISLVVGELSLLQRKILNILLEHAKPHLMAREIHSIAFRDILRLLDYNSNDYRPVRNALEDLPTRKVRWNYLNASSTKDFGVSAYVSQVEFKGDQVEYSYPPKVREMLHSPQRFAVLDLRVQAEFTRQYTLPLYEVLKRCVEQGETPAYSVEQWREVLGVKGAIYDEFKHFNGKVIKPAVEEINGVSDISALPRLHRKGKFVREVSFKVELNRQLPLPLLPESSGQEELIGRMVALGFKRELAQDCLNKYPADYIRENVEVVEARVASGKITANPGGYLARALERDFRKRETEAERLVRERTEMEFARRERERIISKLTEEFARARAESIRHAVDQLGEDEKVSLQEDFVATLKTGNPIGFTQYAKSGLRSAVVKGLFLEYCAPRFGYGDTEALKRRFFKERGIDLDSPMVTVLDQVAAA